MNANSSKQIERLALALAEDFRGWAKSLNSKPEAAAEGDLQDFIKETYGSLTFIPKPIVNRAYILIIGGSR